MTSLPEGFIPHDGGPCPVAPDTLVTVMSRNGCVSSGRYARFWDYPPSWWRWQSLDHDNDIIAYKVENPS
ncbi:hypothetical protein F1640_14785 [Novosphingobium sp. NBM11]|uniref:hypothetical protein n=1 Tax=Novosphingobium sp. NBM11 TaxID=2596914 RepID=UPI001891F91D|nr:hypothetical protein [Novosphingobium sp. NBM11]MBF5091256.1 hypothetical protein [Novosphingobium sp. NBM11]